MCTRNGGAKGEIGQSPRRGSKQQLKEKEICMCSHISEKRQCASM
jgi:hypothetical protein